MRRAAGRYGDLSATDRQGGCGQRERWRRLRRLAGTSDSHSRGIAGSTVRRLATRDAASMACCWRALIVAGLEPAKKASGFAAAWLGRARHEVSILIAGVGGRSIFGRAAALEGLDDDHAAAAAGAGMLGVCGSLASVLAALMASIGSIGTASSSRARAMLSAREVLASRP